MNRCGADTVVFKVGELPPPKFTLPADTILCDRTIWESIYSVDRISRNLKDLLSVIDFFHKNGVSLQIDNLGITSLIDGKVNPSIMIIVQMMGAFSELENEWRKERQMSGIKKAREKGVYRDREHHRRRETQSEFLNKHSKTISLIKKYPSMKNIELAKIGKVHFNTITKIIKIVGIQMVA